MNDTASPRGEEESLFHVGKTEYRKDGLETQAQLRVTPSNLTGSPRQIQLGGFTKYFDLGAHKMINSKLFCVNTNILNLILRDATYGGRYYGSTGLIAKEMGIDAENVRKRIVAMEDDDFLMRMKAENGGRYILLNPHFFCSGGPEDEAAAVRAWQREKSRRIREQDKARKRGP